VTPFFSRHWRSALTRAAAAGGMGGRFVLWGVVELWGVVVACGVVVLWGVVELWGVVVACGAVVLPGVVELPGAVVDALALFDAVLAVEPEDPPHAASPSDASRMPSAAPIAGLRAAATVGRCASPTTGARAGPTADLRLVLM
jgi:hypothetical protein